VRAAVLCLALLGCDEAPPATPPDGGPPLRLSIESPGDQIGLHYGEAMALRVRYFTDAPGEKAVAHGQVRFGIFGDPAGSTLSSDRAITDDDGFAQVSLTAGAAEASFRVVASANNAPDVEFQVSVSRLAFVRLDVMVSYPALGETGTLRALLYEGLSCNALPPVPVPPSPSRAQARTGSSASFSFINLLARSYAVVARAEDARGRLAAAGCVEVGAALLPAGSTATVPVPLEPVIASPIGSYTLATDLAIDDSVSTPVTSPWRALTSCPLGLAQSLLDLIAERVGSTFKSEIAAERGATDGSGCRPSMVNATDSLDGRLQSLLTPSGAPAAQLPSLVADLDTLVATARIESRLTVEPAGASALTAAHTLGSLTVGQAGVKEAKYDLALYDLPIVEVGTVAVAYDGARIAIGTHGFTLRLQRFWQRAFLSEAVAPRFSALTPPTILGLVQLFVSAAQRNGKVGCAAVEDLVCATTMAAACAGSIEPACSGAVVALAEKLEGGFRPTADLDFTLSGQTNAVDSDGDLVIDRLELGSWSTPLASTASFSGTRKP
jgi:hypothetical protein